MRARGRHPVLEARGEGGWAEVAAASAEGPSLATAGGLGRAPGPATVSPGIADAVDHVNRELADRNLAVGPSHFLRKDLTEEWVELIWAHSVLPYLEEQLFGETERLRSFQLPAARARLGVLTATSFRSDLAFVAAGSGSQLA